MSRQMLLKAIENAGGQVRLADKVNNSLNEMSAVWNFTDEIAPNFIQQCHIWNWLNRMKGPVPPAEYVIPIEIATGIPREKLRPDLYVKIEKTQAA